MFCLTAINSSNYKWWFINMNVMIYLGIDGKSLFDLEDVGEATLTTLTMATATLSGDIKPLCNFYGQYLYQMTIRLFCPENPIWRWDQWCMIKQLRLVTLVETLIIIPIAFTHGVQVFLI
eukprot:UN29990